MQSDSLVKVSVQNRIKTITFNQPHKKNAIKNSMAETLRDIMIESATDDCRVIILTGEGSDFSAGADLEPGTLGPGYDVSEFLRTVYNPTITTMREMNKPIIAKVRGVCVGAACSMALSCDMVLADETARFSQIFTRIGLSSDAGGAYAMLEKIGYQKAFELMALNQMVLAEEAVSWGMINAVHPAAELDEKVEEMANRMANGPYIAIQHTKSNLRAAVSQGLEASLEMEAINQGKNFQTKDFAEGVTAFIEKRKAKFRGE